MATAVLDANVLYGTAPRDLLLRMAELGAFQPVWSRTILIELRRALSRRPQATDDNLDRLLRAVALSFPDASVPDSGEHLPRVPDAVHPDDRHVVATALAAGTTAIVTENLRHYPAAELAALGIQVMSLDAFLCSLLPEHLAIAQAVIAEMCEDYVNPPMTVSDILEALSRQAPTFATAVAESGFESAPPGGS